MFVICNTTTHTLYRSLSFYFSATLPFLFVVQWVFLSLSSLFIYAVYTGILGDMSYWIAWITKNRMHYTFTTWICWTSTHVRCAYIPIVVFVCLFNYLIRSCLIVWWLFIEARNFQQNEFSERSLKMWYGVGFWLTDWLNSTTFNKIVWLNMIGNRRQWE